MKLRNVIYQIMKNDDSAKRSHRYTQWKVWERQGIAQKGSITRQEFILKAHDGETIRRNWQKIREEHPEWKIESQEIKNHRESKEALTRATRGEIDENFVNIF